MNTLYRQSENVISRLTDVGTLPGEAIPLSLHPFSGLLPTFIFEDNARSWTRQIITEQQRQALITERRWSDLRNYYPTLGDLLDCAEKKVLVMMFGGDNKAMAALENLCRQNTRLQSLNTRYAKANSDEERQKLESQVKAQEEKCVEVYTEAVKNKPSREAKDLIKYDSKDVLISVIQRLEILAAAGIFRSNPPDFQGANVRVHKIKSLSDEQQILFTKLKLREIFEECKKLGPTPTGTELRRICFLDEAPKYFTDDKDDIINVVARESRKFGLGLWCAAQQPTAFPESFITNCGAKILLGIDSSYWKGSISKLRITEDGLKFIKAKEVISIKLQKEGQSDPNFMNVVVPNPNFDSGRRALEFEGRTR